MICSGPVLCAFRPVSALSYGGTNDTKVRLDVMTLLIDKRAQQLGCEGGALERLSATATRRHYVSGTFPVHVSALPQHSPIARFPHTCIVLAGLHVAAR